MAKKGTSQTEYAARSVAERCDVGIGIEVLVPLIATVLQTLVSSCIKDDQQKAERLQKLVHREWSARRNRYSNMIRNRVERVIRDQQGTGTVSKAEVEKMAVAVLDQIREAAPETVAAVCGEALVNVGQ